jgi:FkbM family methyltransferase
MTKKAEKFKSENKLDYNNLSMKDFNEFPLLSGIYPFSFRDFKFDLLCVRNDDSSVVEHFWRNEKNDPDLNLWADISKEKGIYIDVGSHTGLFTIVSLKSNPSNLVISIEPSYLNLARMMSNLRLNDLLRNHIKILAAASDITGVKNFTYHPDHSFMSKGGKITKNGERINVLKLDDISINDSRKVMGLKIDTEGEDYKVLLGAKNIIKNNLPDILIEVREENKLLIREFLITLGYKLYSVLNKPVETNLIDLQIHESINIFASIKY